MFLRIKVAGLDHLQRLCRIDDIGGGQAEDSKRAEGRRSRPRGREGDHVVLRGSSISSMRAILGALFFTSVRGLGGTMPAAVMASAAATSAWSQVSVIALLAPDATPYRVCVSVGISEELPPSSPVTHDVPKTSRPVSRDEKRSHQPTHHRRPRSIAASSLVQAVGLIAIHLLAREVGHPARGGFQAQHQGALQVILGPANSMGSSSPAFSCRTPRRRRDEFATASFAHPHRC